MAAPGFGSFKINDLGCCDGQVMLVATGGNHGRARECRAGVVRTFQRTDVIQALMIVVTTGLDTENRSAPDFLYHFGRSVMTGNSAL